VSRGRRPALLLGATVLLLGFYVVVYPLHGYRVAVGSDTPVYVWWSRYAGTVGLGGLGTAPRAGLVGPLALLSTILHVPEGDLGAVLGPVLAVVIALAAGSLVEAALGRSDGRFVVTMLLTGTFLTLLAPGFYSTLAFGAAFLAGLASLTEGLDGRSWWPVGAAAGLFAAAGLSHVLFLVLAAAALGGGLLALVPLSRRAVAAGGTWSVSPAGKVVAAAAGGAALVTAGLGLEGSLAQVLRAGSETPVTARDTILRRTGLSSLVRTSYRRKLVHDFPWYRAVVLLGTGLLPFAWPGPRRALDPRSGRRPARRWFFVGAVGAWLVFTLGGIAALIVGLGSPGQRLAAFCLPLPMLGGIGVWHILGARRGSRAGRVVLVLVVLGYGAVAWMAWNNEEPLEPPAALEEARAAGAALAAQPARTPLILVIDEGRERPALFVVRAVNYLRAAVPGDRVADVHAFVGSPEDFLSGHPTLTGRAEHDAMAGAFWHDVAPVRTPTALAVSIQAFDPRRYPRAAALPGSVPIARGVVALPGFRGAAVGCPPSCGANPSGDVGAGPFSPWKPVWLAPVLLAILAIVGAPWSVATSRRRGLGLAPAFGLAALSLAAILTDAAGLRLGSVGGWVALTLALGSGLALAAARAWLSPGLPGPGRTEAPAPLPTDPEPR
jgi:hypothetical protein